jgi:hypothetical protein
MVRSRGSRITAGIAGLLIAGTATAGVASAASAATPAAAGKHWRIIFTAPKVSPALRDTQDFTAVVATGNTTGFAFDGIGAPGGETAWQRTGHTGAAWKKVPFPGKTNEEVAYAAASSPTNVWAFGNNLFNGSRVLRWTGSKFAVVKTFGGSITAASVLGPKDVWVYGLPAGGGVPVIGVWHYNGRTWSRTGKNISGGSALNDHNVWAFTTTSVEHWNGHTWTATPVSRLLPPRDSRGLNHPQVVGILALSASNVYAIGNGNRQDEGGPLVVLHFNGHKWSKLAATGQFGFGPDFQQFSSDGSGGLWLAMQGPAGGTSFLVHYAGGKFTKAAVNSATVTVQSLSRIPGTTRQLAGGFTHASGDRFANVVAALWQYS